MRFNADQLAQEYLDLRPLFEYLLNRAKSDLARQIRLRELTERVFFTGRIKGKNRFVEKLMMRYSSDDAEVRDATRVSDLLALENPKLVDSVALRVVCFDDHAIREIVNTFAELEFWDATSGTVVISAMSTFPDDPLTLFLASSVGIPEVPDAENFTHLFRASHNKDKRQSVNVDQSEDRTKYLDRYEGIRLVVRYTQFHRHDDSGEMDPMNIDKVRRSHVNKLWGMLNPLGYQVLASRVPIEVQIQSVAMYQYNIAQRERFEAARSPLYSLPNSIVRKKSHDYILESLKNSLSSAAHTLRILDTIKIGGFSTRKRAMPDRNYSITGRLPEGLSEELYDLFQGLNESSLNLWNARKFDVFKRNLNEISVAIDGFSRELDKEIGVRFLESDPETLRQYLCTRLVHIIVATSLLRFRPTEWCDEFVKNLQEAGLCSSVPRIQDSVTREPLTVAMAILNFVIEDDKYLRENLNTEYAQNIQAVLLDPICHYRQATISYLRSEFDSAIRAIDESLSRQETLAHLATESDIQIPDSPPILRIKFRRVEYLFLSAISGRFDRAEYVAAINELIEISPEASRILDGNIRFRVSATLYMLGVFGLWVYARNNALDDDFRIILGRAISTSKEILGSVNVSDGPDKVWWKIAKFSFEYTFYGRKIFSNAEISFLFSRIDAVDWHPEEKRKFWRANLELALFPFVNEDSKLTADVVDEHSTNGDKLQSTEGVVLGQMEDDPFQVSIEMTELINNVASAGANSLAAISAFLAIMAALK